MEMEVTSIHYNWNQALEGEDYFTCEVGKQGVVSIVVIGEDYYSISNGCIIDPYAVIKYDDGRQMVQYNLNKINSKPKKEETNG